MDAKHATQLILTLAGILGAAPPAGAEAQSSTKASEPARRPDQPVANRTLQAMQLLVAKYGVEPLYGVKQAIGRGDLAQSVKLASEIREALALAATPEGRDAARRQKLTTQKLAAVKESLDKWDENLPGIADQAGQILQPMYGIKVELQSRTGDLAAMQSMSNELHDALAVLETPAGKVAAEKAKLSLEHLGAVRSALTKLDRAIKATRTKRQARPS